VVSILSSHMSEQHLSASESTLSKENVNKSDGNTLETEGEVDETDVNLTESNSGLPDQELKQKVIEGEHEEETELAPHQPKNQREIDLRSVYVGNIDYSATTDDLKDLFQDCGEINRITIMYNHYTGRSKGFAYVEFADVEGAKAAIALNGTELLSRALTIQQKRTNIPGMGRRRRRRGGFRGERGRGGFSEQYRGRRWHSDKPDEGKEDGENSNVTSYTSDENHHQEEAPAEPTEHISDD